MTANISPVDANLATFNDWTLKYYDWLLEFTCEHVWRCGIGQTLDLYRRYQSPRHLEVGVGTGYFLDRANLPAQGARLTLLDINPHCLRHTAARLARFAPDVIRGDALAPIDPQGRRFDSIAFNYVLHCMPGTLVEKGVAFTNLRPLLNAGGTIFGSTVLRHGVVCKLPARAFMRFYNARRVFWNLNDSLTDLQRALAANFHEVCIEVIGCVAQFSARV
jgi:SAM-dependent methyltransferase